MKKNGFAVGASLAILAICAVFSLYVVQMYTAAQETAAKDYEGEQAYQAAKAGIEFSAYQSLVLGTCSNTSTTFPGLDSFTVSMSCSRTSTSESGIPIVVDSWLVTACNAASCPGGVGPSYVERQMSATFAK
jgi:MSHA biogenesis protein MshP